MQAKKIEAEIEKIKRELLTIGEMRPGSLSQQYAACQKPGCKCIDPVKPEKHGPFYQLSYSHRGKSTTQFVRPEFVDQVRQQLVTYKKFKALTEQWVTLSLELSKLNMQKARAAAAKAPKKPKT